MTERRVKLVLDVDGVLVDFVGATMLFLVRNYGIYCDEPLTNWDFMDTPALRPYRKVAKGHWATPGFAAGLSPIWGTPGVVAEMRHWADIRFATSPMGSNPTWIEERNAWMAAHFGAQPGDVVHTVKKSDVAGDIFVDDKVENVTEYLRTHPQAKVYLRSQSYNVGSSWGGLRTGDLTELIPVVEAMWKSFN